MLSYYRFIAYASKFWNECLKALDSSYFSEAWWITASKENIYQYKEATNILLREAPHAKIYCRN